ncbi:HAD hydrolase-like protein [Streptomyces radicis]|nr:HAD hydrolase-like protein [Streptomyces radicis]
MILGHLDVAPRLRTVVNSAVTGFEKPHPRAFAATRAAAGSSGRLWMVGDNPRADAAGANAAGIDAICVSRARPGDIPDLAAAARIITPMLPGGAKAPHRFLLPPLTQRAVAAPPPVGWDGWPPAM